MPRMPQPPMTTMLSSNSGAVIDLGLGSQLNQQVQDETEEQRKKRMQLAQQQQALGPAGSLAVNSIFGGMGRAGA